MTAAPETVPLGQVEQELTRQLQEGQSADRPVLRARMSNLVIYCDREDLAERVAAEVPAVVAIHPARVLLLIAEPGADGRDVTASVQAWCHLGGGSKICSEQVTLRAKGAAVDRLPFAVRGLLIGDLPTNVWWASAQPPALAGSLLYDLAENAQQVIYDSLGWTEPARGVAATAAWLEKFERGPLPLPSPPSDGGEGRGRGQGRWRVASDLNWRRLKYWRRLLSQAMDPASAPGVIESVSEVIVEHGPHAIVQAWELISWVASRLGWRVQGGRVQPGVEIAWQVVVPRGTFPVRIRRLAEGPSEVRRLRVECVIDGQPGVLTFLVEDERHLAVVLVGTDAAIRTVTIQPQPLAELVGRQLSDRERDPVFRESMAVAQILAQSVLG